MSRPRPAGVIAPSPPLPGAPVSAGLACVARRPDEAEICEGNLAENPLFVLSNKDARPKDKADYVKVIPLGTIIAGNRAIERAIKLHASTEYGYPTTFAYRVLLAIIELARREGFQSPAVRTSRHQLARMLGYAAPGKLVYADIENACNALASLYIQFRGTWYDRQTKASWQNRDGVHLLERVQFRDERQPFLPGLEASESGTITLGQALYASLRAGYFNGVDLQYLNALKSSSLAQMLYAYLTKKDQATRVLTRSLKELGMRFALRKRAPSALYDAFAAALDLLSKPLSTGDGPPRRFLESWWCGQDRDQVTVVFFRDAQGARAALPAPPLSVG